MFAIASWSRIRSSMQASSLTSLAAHLTCRSGCPTALTSSTQNQQWVSSPWRQLLKIVDVWSYVYISSTKKEVGELALYITNVNEAFCTVPVPLLFSRELDPIFRQLHRKWSAAAKSCGWTDVRAVCTVGVWQRLWRKCWISTGFISSCSHRRQLALCEVPLWRSPEVSVQLGALQKSKDNHWIIWITWE